MDPDLHNLARLNRVKRTPPPATPMLGDAVLDLFKQTVRRRQSKLEQIAEAWCQIVPETVSRHCALETFSRGKLTVIVDTSPHLYELKQLLLAGLEAQLLHACRPAGLKRVHLKLGRWYDDKGNATF